MAHRTYHYDAIPDLPQQTRTPTQWTWICPHRLPQPSPAPTWARTRHDTRRLHHSSTTPTTTP
eukprot:546046-Pyramimonas_sp.AAC.1